ncbi:MAG: helix-turn-helix transcriptional regulator [Pirellulales bacterium]|nr:helix-turn-helix transcriptional regulator [Pirellulales bacterium]
MNIQQQLNDRKRNLRMSLRDISRRSGVSRPTLNRLFAGNEAISSKAIAAVAQALGCELTILPCQETNLMLKEQALRKARQLADITQATSALEGQGLTTDEYEALVEQTYIQLMAGSKRKLWQ